jgi:hypothetical protein
VNLVKEGTEGREQGMVTMLAFLVPEDLPRIKSWFLQVSFVREKEGYAFIDCLER